jgi:hypothetical protein
MLVFPTFLSPKRTTLKVINYEFNMIIYNYNKMSAQVLNAIFGSQKRLNLVSIDQNSPNDEKEWITNKEENVNKPDELTLHFDSIMK